MDTGIYIALSKETGIFHDLEVTANNIANTNTTGYQSESLLFSDYLKPTSPQENHVAFANDIATFRDTEQGSLQVTGNTLDAAIQGKGYFVVQTPLGLRYTRNGNFGTNQQGELVTAKGYKVLDTSNQPITFDDADKQVDIRDDGTISVDGSERATMKIVQFSNEQLLQRTSDAMYISDVPPKPAENFQVVAGALERSNVQSFTALTHMMYVTRSVSDTANFISAMYALERKASDTLAKIYS